MHNQDTPENRADLSLKEATKFKNSLFLPEELKPSVYEGFDPLLVSHDIVDLHFPSILDSILDFPNPNNDQLFIEHMKDVLCLLIGEWIEEL